MKKLVTNAAVAASLLVLGVGQAAQAVAEPVPSAPTTTTQQAQAQAQRYAMPSVTGVTLAKALDSITALSPTTQFRVNPTIKGGESTQILSPGSWIVCRQSPAAGNNVSARSNIRLTVERPWNGC